jgi:hypothetical protein
MTVSGNVTGQEIKPNMGAENPRRLLQVQVTDDQDVQTVELFGPSGEDTAPVNGSRVIILQIGNAWKIAIGVDDGVTPTADSGEKILYAINNGAIAAKIHLKADGKVDLNGGTKSAVSYAALNTALQGLVTAINAALATKQDAPGSPGSLTLDLSAAESATVRLP